VKSLSNQLSEKLQLGFGNTNPTAGCRSKKLENQTLADKAFDFVVIQEFFWSVFLMLRWLSRKSLVRLSPGVPHVFTTPFANKGKPSERWAIIFAGGYRLSPLSEYRGNAMGAEGSLSKF